MGSHISVHGGGLSFPEIATSRANCGTTITHEWKYRLNKTGLAKILAVE